MLIPGLSGESLFSFYLNFAKVLAAESASARRASSAARANRSFHKHSTSARELTKVAGKIDGLTWASGTSRTGPTWACFSAVSSRSFTSSCTTLCSGCFMWNALCSSIKNSAGFQRGENSSEIRCLLTGDLLIQTPIKSPEYFIWLACCCITLQEIWIFNNT